MEEEGSATPAALDPDAAALGCLLPRPAPALGLLWAGSEDACFLPGCAGCLGWAADLGGSEEDLLLDLRLGLALGSAARREERRAVLSLACSSRWTRSLASMEASLASEEANQ